MYLEDKKVLQVLDCSTDDATRIIFIKKVYTYIHLIQSLHQITKKK